MESYVPILLFIIVGLLVGCFPIALGHLISSRRPGVEKDSPYECGFPVFENARLQFDVRYYLVAIFFVLFDIEIAFLIPWAVVLKEAGLTAFLVMFVFLLEFFICFLYLWKRRALDWE